MQAIMIKMKKLSYGPWKENKLQSWYFLFHYEVLSVEPSLLLLYLPKENRCYKNKEL